MLSVVGEEVGGVYSLILGCCGKGLLNQRPAEDTGCVKPTLGGLHSAALSPLHFDLNQQGI